MYCKCSIITTPPALFWFGGKCDLKLHTVQKIQQNKGSETPRITEWVLFFSTSWILLIKLTVTFLCNTFTDSRSFHYLYLHIVIQSHGELYLAWSERWSHTSQVTTRQAKTQLKSSHLPDLHLKTFWKAHTRTHTLIHKGSVLHYRHLSSISADTENMKSFLKHLWHKLKGLSKWNSNWSINNSWSFLHLGTCHDNVPDGASLSESPCCQERVVFFSILRTLLCFEI